MDRFPSSGAEAAPVVPAAGTLHALFHNRLVGVELVDADGRWADVNARLCELLGLGREGLVGRAVEDFTHPDDAAEEREHVRRLAVGEASSYRITKRLRGCDGGWFYVEVDATAVGPGGGRAAVLVPIERPDDPPEAERRLRALVEESPAGVTVVDPGTGAFLEFNDAACHSLGYSRDEFAELTVADIETGDSRAEIGRRLDYIVDAGRAHFETLLRTRDGRLASATIHARRVEHRGRPAIQSICQMAPAYEAEGEADGRDALVRQVLHGAPLPMGIVELSKDGNDVLHVFDNPAACRSLGLAPGGSAGRRDGADLGVPRAALDAWIAAYRASRMAGHAVHFEESHDHEGGRRWLGVVVSHVGQGPSGRDRFCYIAEDITGRKRDEEEILRLNRSLERQAAELRAVFEVLPIGVAIADDPECRSIRGNPALMRLLRSPQDANVSLTAPEAERPKSFRAFQDGRELPDDELPMQVVARTGAHIRDVEVEVRFDDGGSILLQEYVSPLFEDDGTARGCVAAILDVTDRRRAEAEREGLLRELRDADRRKDAFLVMLAHELRSPLSAAGNAAQILQMKAGTDPDVRWCCDVIGRQTARLSRLLDDLLDISRIGRGKVVLRREAVDLRDVVERAVETARPDVEARGHRLDVRLQGDPIGVLVDPARIEQVVVNLLANAAKYSEEGRSISVAVRREGAQAVARVEDRGVGMTPDVLARIFDPFTQAESSIGRSQGGLGIGLSIAKALVDMHGGVIAAESDGPGLGSAFTVRLPLADRPGEGPQEPPPPPSPAAGSRRVLVVDDNADAALSLGRLLEAAGHRVATALDGPSAVSLAAEFRPQVAVLDLGLPGMDGFELASRLRAGPGGPGMLLVALTGYGRPDDRRRARRAGFDHHMIKPADVSALLRLLAAR